MGSNLFPEVVCKNHPERDVVAPFADRFCQECHDKAWNAGARQADAEWSDTVFEEDFESLRGDGTHFKTYRTTKRIK